MSGLNGKETFEDLGLDYFIKIGCSKDLKTYAIETNVPDIIVAMGLLEGIGKPGIKNHFNRLQTQGDPKFRKIIQLLQGKLK